MVGQQVLHAQLQGAIPAGTRSRPRYLYPMVRSSSKTGPLSSVIANYKVVMVLPSSCTSCQDIMRAEDGPSSRAVILIVV
jgi:hypothetical protein